MMNVDRLISFLIGVIGGVLSNYIYNAFLKHMRNKNIKIDIEGVWLEEIPADKERSFSIGIIKYDKAKDRYIFDGANYQINGKPYCTWRTVLFYVDIGSMQITYFFKASKIGIASEENSGFGVLNLRINKSGAYTLKDGFYIEAKPEAKSLTHTLTKILPEHIGEKMADNPLDYTDYILNLVRTKEIS